MVDFLSLFGVLLSSLFVIGVFALGVCFCTANCMELVSQQIAIYRIRHHMSAYQRDLDRSIKKQK